MKAVFDPETSQLPCTSSTYKSTARQPKKLSPLSPSLSPHHKACILVNLHFRFMNILVRNTSSFSLMPIRMLFRKNLNTFLLCMDFFEKCSVVKHSDFKVKCQSNCGKYTHLTWSNISQATVIVYCREHLQLSVKYTNNWKHKVKYTTDLQTKKKQSWGFCCSL